MKIQEDAKFTYAAKGATPASLDNVMVYFLQITMAPARLAGTILLVHETMDQAILRETRIKHWKRAWKVRLIHEMNPEWLDLFDERTGEILDGPADAQRLRR